MSKPSHSRKNAPMLLPATKPRNPFGVGVGMGKAGSHQKSNKAQRSHDNKNTREAASMLHQSNDDFSM